MNTPGSYFEIKYTLVYFNRVRVSVSHSIETGSKTKKGKKTSPQKFQCGQKLRKGFRETAMGGSQSVFSEQELSDYQVSFAYTKLSNIRKIEKGVIFFV